MIRRARTGNDVRPLTNGERRAIWASKYYPLQRTDRIKEEERLVSGGGTAVYCTHCGKHVKMACANSQAANVCVIRFRSPSDEPRREEYPREPDYGVTVPLGGDSFDHADFSNVESGSDFSGGGGESAGGGASGDY